MCDFLAAGTNPTFENFVKQIACLINNSVIPLLFSIAVAVFVYGIVQYVINGSDEAGKEKGRQLMVWGIIGLAVMVSIWGMVKLVTNTFGTNFGVPQLQTSP